MAQIRKEKFMRKLMGELEQYVQSPVDEWDEKEFEIVIDLVTYLTNNLQACHADYEDELREMSEENEDMAESDEAEASLDELDEVSGFNKCIICGKMTRGSIGRAGIRWQKICQECKDKADEGLLHRMKEANQLINMYEDFKEWLG